MLRRHCLLFAVIPLLIGLLSPTTIVHAQTATLSLEQYWNLIAETRSNLEAASSLPGLEQAQVLTELAERWRAIQSVKMPDGTTVPVRHQQIVSELQDGNLTALQERLDALEIVRERWGAVVYSPAEAAQAMATLDAILGEAAFQWPEEQSSSFLQKLRERLLRILFDLLPEQAPSSRLITGVIAGVGTLVLLLVLLYVARIFLGSFSSTAAVDDAQDPETGLTAETALDQAQVLSKGGDYRTAVRYLYLSTLLLLDERGLLRYDRTQTNREYLKSVSDHPELATTLRSVIDVFDRVWYGYQSLDQAAYAGYEAQVRDLQRQR